MRRLPLYIITIALAGALLAACGGSDSKDEATPTHQAGTATAASSASATSQPSATSAATQASSATTGPSATASAEAATPTTAAATATNPPPANTQAPTQAPPPPATATPPPASGNPLSASVVATGTVRFFWSPSAVKIAPGGTVTWSWNEPVQPHNVSGADFPLSSDVSKSGSASYTFTSPGVYHFSCDIHPDTMTGTVTVE